ncbi:Srb7p [Sporobolomyces salmoneus]|uniref:Srb7p n=1 Tax=Sporobolomyces salmoneus TaxID=183962 RepID=UPI003177EA1D
MQPEAELGHMDRLTQTQNSIDELIKIMYSSISYLSRQSNFKQLNENYPVTQTIPHADSDDVFEANRKELVSDFLRKAKQLEYLIDSLPSPPSEQELRTEHDLADLEAEAQEANKEYLTALDEAESLQTQLNDSLKAILESSTTTPTQS